MYIQKNNRKVSYHTNTKQFSSYQNATIYKNDNIDFDII